MDDVPAFVELVRVLLRQIPLVPLNVLHDFLDGDLVVEVRGLEASSTFLLRRTHIRHSQDFNNYINNT